MMSIWPDTITGLDVVMADGIRFKFPAGAVDAATAGRDHPDTGCLRQDGHGEAPWDASLA